MNIAIIPARGGSKRIPKKNIKLFNGQPIISYSILKALESKIFDSVLVSTDDIEIARISEYYGAKIPFIRPSNLADDFTTTKAVISHAVKYLIDNKIHPDYICCIYPCAPLIYIKDLVNSFEIIRDPAYQFVYPVTKFPHPIYRSMKRSESGIMEFTFPEFEITRTQDLEEFYHDSAQFYWGKMNSWVGNLKMHSNGFGMPIPNWRVVDIDNESDWTRAEILFNILKNDSFQH